MILHILMAMGAVAAWVAFVLISPTRRCSRCKGTLRTTRRWTGRAIGCPRCRKTGRHYRLGAVLVHRLAWRLAGDWLAGHARARLERYREGRP